MRISFGFIAAIIIFFGFFIIYALVSPAWDIWYEIAMQMGSARLIFPTQFLNIAWNLLPLAVLIYVIIWLIVSGMGEASNPGKLLLGVIVLTIATIAMMVSYVTIDPIVINMSSIATMYAGIFAPVIGVVTIVWYNYSIPFWIAVAIWTLTLAIQTEAETIYV